MKEKQLRRNRKPRQIPQAPKNMTRYTTCIDSTEKGWMKLKRGKWHESEPN